MYGIINKTNVQNVKNTMIDTLLSTISPHLCYACGRIGAILCENCKYDISYDRFGECILCSSVGEPRGICSTCKPCFSRAWCVGQRKGVLRKVIDDYKFENVMAAHVPLAALLSTVIGTLPLFCCGCAHPHHTGTFSPSRVCPRCSFGKATG